MSSSRIKNGLERTTSEALSPHPTFQLELPPAELEKIRALQAAHSLTSAFDEEANPVIACQQELTQLDQFLQQLQKNQQKLLIKSYRLALIKAFERYLMKLAKVPTQQEPQKPSRFRLILPHIFYGMLVAVGLVMDGSGSFLGGQELIQLIPGVSNTLAIAVGAGFGLINSVLFYAFEARMLKQAMEVDSLGDLSLELSLDEKEIVAVSHMNELMIGPLATRIKKADHDHCAGLVGSLNMHIQNKKRYDNDSLGEGKTLKFLRYFITGVGAAMVAGLNYFMAKSLIAFAAPALIGTPLSWLLIGIGICTMLFYYASMRGQAMGEVFTPAIKIFKSVKSQRERFISQDFKTKEDLTNAYQEQNIIKLRRDINNLKSANQRLEQTVAIQEDKAESRQEEKHSPPAFNFTLDKTIRTELDELIERNPHINLQFPSNTGVELELIKSLQAELTYLGDLESQLKKNQDKLLIKKYRLAIIKAFEQHLQPSAMEDDKPQATPALPFWKYLGYGLLLSVGLIMDGIGTFLGGQELISLVPGVPGPLALVVGILFSIINAALFYSFEAGLLRQNMGINSLDMLNAQIQVSEEELARTHKINQLMMSQATAQLDSASRQVYTEFAVALNETAKTKKETILAKKLDSPFYTRLRHAVTVLGAIMIAGLNYFMAKSLLDFAAPALVGTPLGWILITIGIGTMLAFYFSMRGKAMGKVLNPSMEQFAQLKKNYSQFEPLEKKDFELAYRENQENKTVQELENELNDLKKKNEELEKLKEKAPPRRLSLNTTLPFAFSSVSPRSGSPTLLSRSSSSRDSSPKVSTSKSPRTPSFSASS